ncbi:hypothetical protein [Ammoniphilus sp. YIM 78166]|uniref:hypothetical protein n=1 Tax=Ammoniphilus sp. YIM 78166 TaxID=1644106 RepID=UPI00106F6309|nr:hypothetical protein [Ammoniphilus sp. YIM 78166]
MKKWLVILGTLLACSIAFNVNLYLKNRAYEGFLAEHIANKVSPLSTSILKSRILLEGILTKNVMTYEEAEELNSHFRKIAMEAQDLVYMGNRFNSFSNPLSNQLSLDTVRDKIIFEGVVRDYHPGEVLTLDEDRKAEIQRLYDRMKRYEMVIHKHVSGATPEGMEEHFWKKARTLHPYWSELIEELTHH